MCVCWDVRQWKGGIEASYNVVNSGCSLQGRLKDTINHIPRLRTFFVEGPCLSAVWYNGTLSGEECDGASLNLRTELTCYERDWNGLILNVEPHGFTEQVEQELWNDSFYIRTRIWSHDGTNGHDKPDVSLKTRQIKVTAEEKLNEWTCVGGRDRGHPHQNTDAL